MQAYAYLRVSGKGQVDGDGFTRQESAIRKFAESRGIGIADVYRERGVSGKVDGMHRPTWVEMITHILANGVRTVIVERLDRLARDLMIQEHILADLKRRGIEIISAAEPDLCSDDPSRKMLRQIVGAIAEYDKAMIVLKTRAARERIRASGKTCEGAKPYGFTTEEKRVLEAIRVLSARGHSPAAIAKGLNAKGVLPRRGKAWHPHAVARILDRAVKE